MSTIGERVKQKRESRGLSQTALAELMTAGGAKWSQSKVWKMEAGQQPLHFSEAIALAEILGVDLDFLAGAAATRDHYANGYCDGLNAARKAVEGLFA